MLAASMQAGLRGLASSHLSTFFRGTPPPPRPDHWPCAPTAGHQQGGRAGRWAGTVGAIHSRGDHWPCFTAQNGHTRLYSHKMLHLCDIEQAGGRCTVKGRRHWTHGCRGRRLSLKSRLAPTRQLHKIQQFNFHKSNFVENKRGYTTRADDCRLDDSVTT